MAGYGTDAEFQSWLTNNGFVLPVDAPNLAVLRQRGSDYVDATYASRLLCTQPTGGIEQERAWPRVGGAWPDDAIPSAWVRASYRAAFLDAQNPGSLWTTTNPNARIKRQKVDGAVEREFFDNGASASGNGSGAVVDSIIDGIVGPYLCSEEDHSGLFLRAVGS